MRSSSSANQTLKVVAISCVCLLAACSSNSSKKPGEDQPSGVVVVNAPAAGEVRRILVSEGAQVSAGTPIVEIAVQDQTRTAAPNPGETAESKAVVGVRSSQGEIDAARAEVIKHQAEVDRLTPLVAAGQASQPQLDGERALYERAQQRLQKAQAAEQQAEVELRVARQPGAQGITTQQSAPREQIVVARATSGGTVAVISTHVGDRVMNGQPLATLRADAP
jgi:multidrug efflux pump subunit AcrA (membrane-fusion protein)